ncbi:MAG: hypothetical protein ABJA67_00660 [Chthonomonadales bacterium]
MRTTIDIPEPLLRRAKATAAMRGMKLKDLITSFVESGLENNVPVQEARGNHGPLPVFLRTNSVVPSLSNAEIEAILIKEELESLARY